MASQKEFRRVHVEISNVCNLACSYCPIEEKDKQHMSADQFAAIAAQIAPHTDEVSLHLLGEPLAHSDFAKVIGICSELDLPVHVVTNGLLLPARSSEVLHPSVRQVSISVQSFEDNYPNQNPKLYIERLKSFVSKAEELRPDLYINLRLWDVEAGFRSNHSPHSNKTRVAFAEVFGFDWNDVQRDVRRRKNWRLSGRTYLHFDTRFRWPNSSDPIRSNKGRCHGLNNHFGIHADGTVVPCCLDHEASIPLGNAFETPIKQILASPRAQRMRDGFAKGLLVEDLCQRCTYIERFDKSLARQD